MSQALAHWNLPALRHALDQFRQHLEGTHRVALTTHTYVDQANRFVRWLAGEYRPRALAQTEPPRQALHEWTASDLRADHRAYREMLQKARLKPLAIQTYVHASGVFVSWLTGTRPEFPQSPPVIPAPNVDAGPPDPPQADDWLWEGNVQRVLKAWLVEEGWQLVSEADPAIRQHGIDLLLRRGDRELAIEVKGYPQTRMRRGANAGQPRVYHPAAQAGQYFAGALQSAMRMRDAHPTKEIAIGLPETRRYEDLIEKSVRSLEDLGVGVFFVRADGTAHIQISPRRR